MVGVIVKRARLFVCGGVCEEGSKGQLITKYCSSELLGRVTHYFTWLFVFRDAYDVTRSFSHVPGLSLIWIFYKKSSRTPNAAINPKTQKEI